MRKGKPNGFTLPELLVVLLLLAVLFTMIAPSLGRSWQRVMMDVTIQQLHRDIRWAQRQAAREQCMASITFFRDKQPYRYVVRVSNKPNYLRRRELPDRLSKMEGQTILIQADKRFLRNGHVLLQKGEEKRYVYYYQTGRSRVTRAPTA